MYVAIDRDRCAIIHKHPDLNVVANLVFIEAPDNTVDIMPEDTFTMFHQSTLMEMQKFYFSLTGKHTDHHAAKLRGIICELVKLVPVTDCEPFEVEVQSAFCEARHPLLGMRYVKGATTPNKPLDLWEPEELRASGTIDEASISAPAPTQRAEKRNTPGEPRPGTKRATIWEVADRMWKEDGSPVDKASVLSLRLRIMKVLESDYDIGKTSSSELGQWQKARI